MLHLFFSYRYIIICNILFFLPLYIAIPIFINDSELSISEVMHRHVSLSCTAEGSPAPSITWIKSGGEIFEESMNANENIIVTNTVTGMMVESTLTINSTDVLDSSTYICVARNNVGSANITAVVLTVEGELMHYQIIL